MPRGNVPGPHPAGFTSARSPFARLMMKPMQQALKGFVIVMDDGTKVFFVGGEISRIDLPMRGGATGAVTGRGFA